ncbi:MAG: phage scaffolding protein [Clostridia bacterium]|nr:phage scaffolding protein [Clostridia bacterium]
MKKEDLIAKGLSEEQAKAVLELYDTEIKDYVPKADYYNAVKEKENAAEQLEAANNTIADLKKENKDNETLQNKIKDHETTINELKAEAENIRKTYAIKEMLSKEGVTDPDYVIYKQGGIDKFTFDKEGKPVGVSDVVKSYKEDASMAHLFQQTQQNYNPAGGDGKRTVNPFMKETFNLTEQGKILKENPAQAREMASAAGITI